MILVELLRLSIVEYETTSKLESIQQQQPLNSPLIIGFPTKDSFWMWNKVSYYRPKTVWGKVIFSEASVWSRRGGGSLYDVTSFPAAWSHVPSRGLCPWSHVPFRGVSVHWVCPLGSLLSRIRQAGGTHPTLMFSRIYKQSRILPVRFWI